MNEKYKEFNLDTKNTKFENLSQLFFIRHLFRNDIFERDEWILESGEEIIIKNLRK